MNAAFSFLHTQSTLAFTMTLTHLPWLKQTLQAVTARFYAKENQQGIQ